MILVAHQVLLEEENEIKEKRNKEIRKKKRKINIFL